MAALLKVKPSDVKEEAPEAKAKKPAGKKKRGK
jgi:hypothetical protein